MNLFQRGTACKGFFTDICDFVRNCNAGQLRTAFKCAFCNIFDAVRKRDCGQIRIAGKRFRSDFDYGLAVDFSRYFNNSIRAGILCDLYLAASDIFFVLKIARL